MGRRLGSPKFSRNLLKGITLSFDKVTLDELDGARVGKETGY